MKPETKDTILSVALFVCVPALFIGSAFAVRDLQGPAPCHPRVCEPSAWSDCTCPHDRHIMRPIGDGSVMCVCDPKPPDDDDDG